MVGVLRIAPEMVLAPQGPRPVGDADGVRCDWPTNTTCGSRTRTSTVLGSPRTTRTTVTGSVLEGAWTGLVTGHGVQGVDEQTNRRNSSARPSCSTRPANGSPGNRSRWTPSLGGSAGASGFEPTPAAVGPSARSAPRSSWRRCLRWSSPADHPLRRLAGSARSHGGRCGVRGTDPPGERARPSAQHVRG